MVKIWKNMKICLRMKKVTFCSSKTTFHDFGTWFPKPCLGFQMQLWLNTIFWSKMTLNIRKVVIFWIMSVYPFSIRPFACNTRQVLFKPRVKSWTILENRKVEIVLSKSSLVSRQQNCKSTAIGGRCCTLRALIFKMWNLFINGFDGPFDTISVEGNNDYDLQ